ncbi:ribosomal protein subunit S2 [Capsaspora owczarzaki ATCC 30864]|uniref:Ribosomal protein subunit S2 n=1 Tax=Capsaspora owczarzaki (strain ATCC 30864) TaxID=595528 RepID=A0A0D2WUK2_CAPO3|nr:ribosomal protein subunit S2 [Capsaspora owczarzaki ATCC 30864]KJE96385.1 ribosomal protein subunit S2 [Capsaspora owczarzaki ATCC 30864]|eukprot:XP_004344339.2 ribosomal protein subunit S2 [Capsaspora owczarzaki ATCC 30864]
MLSAALLRTAAAQGLRGMRRSCSPATAAVTAAVTASAVYGSDAAVHGRQQLQHRRWMATASSGFGSDKRAKPTAASPASAAAAADFMRAQRQSDLASSPESLEQPLQELEEDMEEDGEEAESKIFKAQYTDEMEDDGAPELDDPRFTVENVKWLQRVLNMQPSERRAEWFGLLRKDEPISDSDLTFRVGVLSSWAQRRAESVATAEAYTTLAMDQEAALAVEAAEEGEVIEPAEAPGALDEGALQLDFDPSMNKMLVRRSDDATPRPVRPEDEPVPELKEDEELNPEGLGHSILPAEDFETDLQNFIAFLAGESPRFGDEPAPEVPEAEEDAYKTIYPAEAANLTKTLHTQKLEREDAAMADVLHELIGGTPLAQFQPDLVAALPITPQVELEEIGPMTLSSIDLSLHVLMFYHIAQHHPSMLKASNAETENEISEDVLVIRHALFVMLEPHLVTVKGIKAIEAEAMDEFVHLLHELLPFQFSGPRFNGQLLHMFFVEAMSGYVHTGTRLDRAVDALLLRTIPRLREIYAMPALKPALIEDFAPIADRLNDGELRRLYRKFVPREVIDDGFATAGVSSLIDQMDVLGTPSVGDIAAMPQVTIVPRDVAMNARDVIAADTRAFVIERAAEEESDRPIATPIEDEEERLQREFSGKSSSMPDPVLFAPGQHQRTEAFFASLPLGRPAEAVGNAIVEPKLFLSEHSVTLRQLFDAGVHLGHKAGCHNVFANSYIFGERDGIHIIDLEQTIVALRRACRVLKHIAYQNGVILFVGGRSKHKQLVRETAMSVGEYYIANKWMPGTLTNPMSTLGALRQPDLIVLTCMPMSSQVAREANLANVPTIGIADTDCDPRQVTYSIPANDDSPRSMALLLNVMRMAIEEGKTKRQAGLPLEYGPTPTNAPFSYTTSL